MQLFALTSILILCIYAEVETTAHLSNTTNETVANEETSIYDLPYSLVSFEWLTDYMKYEKIDYEYINNVNLKITMPTELENKPFAYYVLKRMFVWMQAKSDEPHLAKWKTMFSKEMQDLININLFKMFSFDQKDFGDYSLDEESEYDLIKWLQIFAEENGYEVEEVSGNSITIKLNEGDQKYDIINHIFQVIGALMAKEKSVMQNVNLMSRYLIEKEFQSISNLITLEFDGHRSASEYDKMKEHEIVLPNTIFPFADAFLKHLQVGMRYESENKFELTLPEAMVGMPLVDYIYPKLFDWMKERLEASDLMRFNKIFSSDFGHLVQEHIEDRFNFENATLDASEIEEEQRFTLIDFFKRYAEKNNLQVVKETNATIEIEAEEYSEEDEYNLQSHVFVLLGRKVKEDPSGIEKLGLFADFLIANELNEFFSAVPQNATIAKRQIIQDQALESSKNEENNGLQTARDGNEQSIDGVNDTAGENRSRDTNRDSNSNDSRGESSGQSQRGSRNRQRNNNDLDDDYDDNSYSRRRYRNRANRYNDEDEDEDDYENNGRSRNSNDGQSRGNRYRRYRGRNAYDSDEDDGDDNRRPRGRGRNDQDRPRRFRNRQNDEIDDDDRPRQNRGRRNGDRNPVDDEREPKGRERDNTSQDNDSQPRNEDKNDQPTKDSEPEEPRNKENDDQPRHNNRRQNEEDETPRRQRNRQYDLDDDYPSNNGRNNRRRGRRRDSELEDILQELDDLLSNSRISNIRGPSMMRQNPNMFMRHPVFPFPPPFFPHGHGHMHRSINSPMRRQNNFFRPLQSRLENNDIEIEDMKITEFVREFREKASTLVTSPRDMRQLFLVLMREIYDNLIED